MGDLALKTRLVTNNATKRIKYLDTLPLRALKNCYGKSRVRITRDFFFVDLRKKLNSLTPKFRQVVDIYNNTGWNWKPEISLTKTERASFLKFSGSYEKDTTKTPKPNNG